MVSKLRYRDLVKLFKYKEDALKQAILNVLNMDNPTNRKFLYIKSLEDVDNNYFRVEVQYKDIFVFGTIEDTGIYYILKESL